MVREIDRRDPAANQTTPARERSLNERALKISELLSGPHTLSIEAFDDATGNPSLVASEGAEAETGNFVQRALNHVQSIGTVLGLEETQAPEFMADPNVQISSSGAATVHLQQQYKGIRLFQTAQGVRFNPNGSISDTVGNSVTIAEELDAAPKLNVQEAVLRAARHLAEPGAYDEEEVDEFGQSVPPPALDLEGFTPKVVATFPNHPEYPTVLEAGPFGDEIKANLIWFPLGAGPRLAWEVLLIMPGQGGQYRVLVAADDGEILYCRQLMSTVEAEGHVYVVDGAGDRQVVRFPRALADFNVPLPEGLPEGFPDPWVASDSALGNAVKAFLATSGETFRGTQQNGRLVFQPTDPVGEHQQVLNIFYYNCVIHDFFYLYGFRESDGNFQQDNFGRGGALADPVTAFAHPGPVVGTANMSTRVDGQSPVMNMGLVAQTGRHTAFDSTVVFHEFTHGVTNRLVGGPMNTQALEDYQSAGMGEGWGDYIACTINNTTVVGAWVTDKPAGIRKFPYDENYPDHFGKLGTGRFNRPELNKQHAVGEIWCATLMEMNRKIGSHLGVQLVVDALKLSPVRPSFLDMRDSILKALDNKLAAGQLSAQGHATAHAGIWAAFARFGMGPGARSNGASLTGIVADFNTPSDQPVHFDGEVGSAFPTPGVHDDAQAGGSSASYFGDGAEAEEVADGGPEEETRGAFADVLAAIQIHGEELATIPGVVSVAPGYRFQGGDVTPRPVVTVTVLRKLDPADVAARDLIPARLGKVLVDVLPATPQQQLAFLRQMDEAATAGLPAPAGEINTRLPGELGGDVLAEAEAAFDAVTLAYVPPPVPLAEVNEEMTVLCHASPDAGFRNLSKFIAGTQVRLTSTMYEFNARHVLDALKALKPPRKLRLILDGGSPNQVPGPPANTVSKLAARTDLETTLKTRFKCVWAPVRDDGMTTAGFFPTAYHTKVSVRDGEAFWLSSGNWKESGQPKVDPIEGPLPPGFSKQEFESNHNREWHVIVHNPKLAETFETYINHDISQAEPLQKPAPAPPPSPLMPDLFVPAEGPSAFAAFDSEPQFFSEQEFTKKIRVQPLMTPDNYAEQVLPLIRGAKRSLYFQNQQVSPKPGNSRYMPLFLALRDKSVESAKPNATLDVKIIVSEYTDLDKLKNWNFEMSRVRRQYQCHNKGIIIDDKTVVVGSHNWTGQGATENRDASLIFYDDPEIAAYFKKIFMYDWNRIGVTDSLMLSMPLVAMPGEEPPPGMIRVAWSDFFPDWREAEA
ncbi:MAG TPA: M36 family metallopeptidase [Pyrinomonadaceae bacterium]|jgi:extracellular elastinolytic metalloproteinase